MTTHAHDTQGTGPIADPRGAAEGDYVDERDLDQRDRYDAEPQRSDRTAEVPTATTQPLAREDIPSTPHEVDAPAPHEVDATAPREEDATAPPAADGPVGQLEPPAADRPSSSAAQEPATEEALFPADDLAGLRSRWNDVQAGFVDDPKRCVETADGLVSDVVQQLASSFAHARSKLEDQWTRGEDVSTEDLRLALKRYREFFERLLAV